MVGSSGAKGLFTLNICGDAIANTNLSLFKFARVPTRPGKPDKMRVHLENLEISWNLKNLIKSWKNDMKTGCALKTPPNPLNYLNLLE